MSTFVFARIESFQKRLNEIDLILNYASENEGLNKLYTSLCRAAQVLLIAHFEGAVKDFTKDVIDDFNRSEYEFKDSPKALKITYCSSFIKENTDPEYRFTNKLINTFDTLPVKYDSQVFLYKNNKNPRSYIVNNILQRFGVTKFLSQIENSDLDIAFQDSKSDLIGLRDKLKLHLTENVSSYPYTVNFELFNIHYNKKIDAKKKSIWEDFLDEVVNNRHNIAHGNLLDSMCSHKEIEMSKLKIEILTYAYVLLLCKFALPAST